MDPNPGPGRELGEGYRLVALGGTFAGAVVMFMAAGWGLDRWLGVTPLFTVTGALVGAGLGFLSVYRRVRQDTEDEVAARRKKGPGGVGKPGGGR
jgi:F0F1-type ATP synthase assembly protein I